MFNRKCDKIEIEFKQDKVYIERFVGTTSFEELLKYLNNMLIRYYNDGEYNKADYLKELLQHLYFVNKKYGQQNKNG